MIRYSVGGEEEEEEEEDRGEEEEEDREEWLWLWLWWEGARKGHQFFSCSCR